MSEQIQAADVPRREDSARNWSDFAEILRRELHRLMANQQEWIAAEDLLPDGESRVAAANDLLRLDLETRDALDTAVREFCTSSRWPTLTMDARCMLGRRIFCALDLLNSLTLPARNPVVPHPTAAVEAVLTWLLVDTWRARSRRWLTSVAAEHGDWEALSERPGAGRSING